MNMLSLREANVKRKMLAPGERWAVDFGVVRQAWIMVLKAL
jgi:hypothetical protein